MRTPMAEAPSPPLASPFSFDLSRCVVVDAEVYPGRWCVGFGWLDDKGKPVRRLIDGDRAKLSEVLDWFASRSRILIGYNSQHFDVPVIRAILGGHDPFAPAQSLIRDGWSPLSLWKLPPFKPDHIDLAARLSRGRHFPSLKDVAANLGRRKLRELPYPPEATLTDEQWDEVKRYNGIDLAHTWDLLERMAPELQALASSPANSAMTCDRPQAPGWSSGSSSRLTAASMGERSRQGPRSPREVLYRPVEASCGPGRPMPRLGSIASRASPSRSPAIGDKPRVQVPKRSLRDRPSEDLGRGGRTPFG